MPGVCCPPGLQRKTAATLAVSPLLLLLGLAGCLAQLPLATTPPAPAAEEAATASATAAATSTATAAPAAPATPAATAQAATAQAATAPAATAPAATAPAATAQAATAPAATAQAATAQAATAQATAAASPAAEAAGKSGPGGREDPLQALKGVRFPTTEQLARLGDAPLPARLSEGEELAVDHWELQGPFPAPGSLSARPLQQDGGLWGGLLRELTEADKPRLWRTEAMSCLARELGRYVLRHRSRPDRDLHRRLASLCGVISVAHSVDLVSGRIDEGAKEEELFSRWWSTVQEMVLRRLGEGHREIGLWFGREKGQALAFFVSGQRRLQVRRAAVRQDRLELEGELLVKVERVEALVTRGAHGVEECRFDPSLRLPRFAMSCALDPQDALPRLELLGFEPVNILGMALLDQELSTAPPASRYQRATGAGGGGAGGEPARAAQPAAELLRLVVEARRRAGLGPLRLLEAESATARLVAPQYLAAVYGLRPPLVAEVIARGLSAGWQVDEPVRRGRFGSAWITGSREPAALLDAALASPSARRVLLDPQVSALAIGVASAEMPRLLGAVFAGYALFPQGETLAAEAQQLFARLAQARKAKDRGQTLPFAPAGLAPLLQGWRRAIQQHGARPEEQLELLIEEARPLGVVRGWTVEVDDLERLGFPHELLVDPRVAVSISVDWRKAAGQPWARRVVLILASPG